MKVTLQFQALAAVLVSIVSASPCPYGDLAERGLLPRDDAAKFFAARAEGDSAAEHELKQRSTEQAIEFEAQEKYYKRQLDLGDLNLGGGLLNGVLQPFSGVLAALDVPV